MLGFSSLGALLVLTIVGALVLVPGGLAVWVFLSHPSVDSLTQAILDVLAQAETRKATLGAVFGTASLVVGLLIDALGHAIVDEKLRKWTRKRSLGESEAALLQKSTPPGMDSGSYVESVFYANAPEHVLTYHSEQWAYYEFYRNLLIVLVLQLVLWGAVLMRFGHIVWTIGLLLAGGVGAWVLVRAIRFMGDYYYQVETAFVIGRLLNPSRSTQPRSTFGT